MESKMYWFNFKTNEYEFISCPTDFSDYIPQESAAQALYRLHQKMGREPLEAAVKMLEAACGVPQEKRIP